METQYKSSRVLYILEAALEYFIAIAVSSVYLAKVTAYMGLSDGLTGILSAFVSLGCGFQLFAVFLVHKRPVKRWVTAGHIVSQILFAGIYFVPLLDIAQRQKTGIFVCMLLGAYIIHNIINSPKINWFMSLVEDGKRGRFTANKEIVSLLSGVAFSYALGAVMDHYEQKGDMRTAFAVCGIGLVILMILHSCTLIFSKEKPVSHTPVPVAQNLGSLMRNKTLFKIILVSVLWNIANYATTSFTGVYQAKELAFSTTFSSVILMLGSLLRALASRPMGRFADKYSFRQMLSLCFIIEAIAFGLNAFTTPANGKWMYLIYYLFSSVGWAGINNAIINFIYDYVEFDQRTSALALQQTCAGFSGFFAVLLFSPAVEWMQKHPIMFRGNIVYAQQILSVFSCVCLIGIILYLHTVIKKLKKV